MNKDENRTDVKEHHSFTRKQARNWIMEAPHGTKFYAMVALDLHIPTVNPEHFLPEPRKGSIGLGKRQALSMLQDIMESLGEDVQVKCMTHTDAPFDYIAYWIGI